MIPEIRKKTDKYNLIAFSSESGEMTNKADKDDYQFIVSYFPSMESVNVSGRYIEQRMGDQFIQRWEVPKGIDPSVFLITNAEDFGIDKSLLHLKGRPLKKQATPTITPKGVVFRKKSD